MERENEKRDSTNGCITTTDCLRKREVTFPQLPQLQDLIIKFTKGVSLTPPSTNLEKHSHPIKDNNFEITFRPVASNCDIKKVVYRKGSGQKLEPGNLVSINFYLYAEGHDNCLGSNMLIQKPFVFELGRKRGGAASGIPFIGFGTLGMKVKEIAVFLGTPKHAWSKSGNGTRVCTHIDESNVKNISPQTRMLCIIEVLSKLASPSESCSIVNMVSTERKLLKFEELYEFATKRKSDGNKYFASQRNTRALRNYFQAANCLEDAIPRDANNAVLKTELLHILYQNICSISMRTGQYKTVIQFTQKSLQLNITEDKKAMEYFRCATALYFEGNWEEAKCHIDKVVMLHNDFDDEVNDVRKNIYAMVEETSSKNDTHKNKNDQIQNKRKVSFCGSLALFKRSSN